MNNQLCTDEVWEQLKTIPLEHWVALSLNGAQILASGENLTNVRESAAKICTGEYMLTKNPRILLKPLCFLSLAIAH